LLVPVAIPDAPVELAQVICATPALSDAVPLTTIELADVEEVTMAGDRTVMEGAVVSEPGLGLLGAGEGVGVGTGSDGGLGGCWVTVRLCVARVCIASTAVTVITFAPTLNGIAPMVQFEEPCAAPEAP
jgi:hypothetical protein